MNRRGFLGTLVAAPAVILTPGLLMPVRKVGMVPELAAPYVPYIELPGEKEFFQRLAYLMTNPPLIEHVDFGRVTYEMMKLHAVPHFSLDRRVAKGAM